MSGAYVLYGWHLSYFSGKVRCYLQHKIIPFTDAPVDLWTLIRRIRGRFGIPVMPVVASAGGEWLQDSSDRMAQAPPPATGDLPTDNSLPATLAPVLRLIVDEFLPMAEAIQADASAALDVTSPGALLPRGLGPIRHPMGNVSFERTALPFVLWKMQRLLDVHAGMTPAEQHAVRTWLKSLGGERLLDIEIPRLRRVGVLVELEEKKAA